MIVLGGLQDIYMSYNMFFILDEHQKPDIIRDESRQISYAVQTVIRYSATLENEESDTDSGEDSEEERRNSLSSRMFD